MSKKPSSGTRFANGFLSRFHGKKDMVQLQMQTHPYGEAFVFRDFERSKILALRQAVERAPLKMSAQFFGIVAFWTILMSAGAGLHGVNTIALNLAPHVALYTAAVGLFIYPVRLAWIPLLSMIAAFAYPFFQPFVRGDAWYQNPFLDPETVFMLFLFNIAGAVAIAGALRLFFAVALQRTRAHSADLLVSLFAYFMFVVLMFTQMYAMIAWAKTLPQEMQSGLGFTADFETLTINRIFRGAVVLAGFLLAATEIPTRREMILSLLCVPLFPLVALAHLQGYGLFPMLDVVLLALLLMVAIPVASGITAAIIGFAIYASLTGNFLNDKAGGSVYEVYLNQYSIAALGILIYIQIFRSRTKHVLQNLTGNIRRLEKVRDFAGVGLFSANLSSDRFQLDSAAARLLGVADSGRLVSFLHGFDIASRDRLTDTLAKPHIVGETLELHVAPSQTTANAVVRLYLWSETSPIGDRVVYGLMLDETDEAARHKAQEMMLAELSARDVKQRQIFSMVSHEVRTPASVISMLIDDLPTETPDQLRRQLRDSTDQLLRVLSDMRQAVNPEQNLPLRLEPYQPATLAEGIIASMQTAAKAANMILHLDLDDSANQDRLGDITRLRQVLSNLVRNALLHSQARTVELRFRSKTDESGRSQSVWTVSDDGRGIAAEDISRIFEPFERGRETMSQRIDGSGLGLYIARSAVEVMGGTLTYHAAQGGGAAFEISLPDTVADTTDPSGQHLPQKPKPSVRAPRHLSILLAEDNPIVAEVVTNRLRRDFDTVRLVTTGQELVDAMNGPHPDVVISDLFMPVMDGDKAAAALRAAGYGGPIIGLTAAAVADEAARFRQAGATAVLFKPLDNDLLHHVLVHGHLPEHAAEQS